MAPVASWYYRLAVATLLGGAAVQFWRGWSDREIPVPGRWEGRPAEQPPAPDENALGRPKVWGAARGTGFVLDWKGRPYLVSCYHVFGDGVDGVTLARGDASLGEASGRLPIRGRKASFEPRNSSRDLAVFPMTTLFQPSRHLKLAASPPRVGQPVWLFHVAWQDHADRAVSNSLGVGQPPWRGLLSSGIVTRSSNHAVEFRYDAGIDAAMTSGAPLVDQRGDVVGVNVGDFSREGRLYGLATPHATLLKALTEHGLER